MTSTTIRRNQKQNPKPACPKWLIVLGVASIVVATLLVYLPAIRGEFIWDDDYYVSDNHLLQDLSGLGKIWSFKMAINPDGEHYLSSHTVQYYPLVFTTFWLESQMWGQDNPSGFHAVNILLHIANALLVWLICHRLGFSWGFLAALIFALHPVEVESVAWITERKNVLSGLFYLLALLAYLRFDESRRKAFYFTALVCFVLALLSKTVTCTLPVILLLMLWLRHRRLLWLGVVRLIPFFAIGALVGIFTAYLEHYQVGAVGGDWHIAFWQRFVIAGKAVFFYTSKLLWPSELTFIYHRWNPAQFPPWTLVWPGAAIVLTAALWYWRKSIGRPPLVAWAGFVITLFPALGFVDVYPFRFSFVADHFQYLASIFCIALFVGLGHALYVRFCARAFGKGAGPRIILPLIVVLLLGYFTHAQARMYEDIEVLWKKTISKNSKAWMAWNNLGLVYLNRGDLELAISNFNQAIELNAKHDKAYYNRGTAHLRKNDYDRAIRDLDKSIELNPQYVRAYNNRGLAYMIKGDYTRAIRDLDQAIELNPDYTNAYSNAIVTLIRRGTIRDALRYARQAIRRGCAHPGPLNALARILASFNDADVRDGAAAVSLAERACQLVNYKTPKFLDTLAAAYAEVGQFDRAVNTAQDAVRLARNANKDKLARDIQDRLELYRSKRPYRR